VDSDFRTRTSLPSLLALPWAKVDFGFRIFGICSLHDLCDARSRLMEASGCEWDAHVRVVSSPARYVTCEAPHGHEHGLPSHPTQHACIASMAFAIEARIDGRPLLHTMSVLVLHARPPCCAHQCADATLMTCQLLKSCTAMS
jgi:hypothetical protein